MYGGLGKSWDFQAILSEEGMMVGFEVCVEGGQQRLGVEGRK